jgi:hypothetical protein
LCSTPDIEVVSADENFNASVLKFIMKIVLTLDAQRRDQNSFHRRADAFV